MAIIYSYPHATPTINDMVLGAKFRENDNISTNSFYISDLATIVSDEIGIPTLQDVTGEGANTTIQMQINGVDVATLNDIPGTPTLQEVVEEGNTVSGGNSIVITNGPSLRTDIYASNISMFNSTNFLDIYPNSIFFQKQLGSGSVELKFPNTINDTRVIEFPNASGTIALINDLVTPNLQQVTDEGSTTTNSVVITSGGNSGLTVEGFKNGITGQNNAAWIGGWGVKGYSENGYGVYADCGPEASAGIYASSAVKPGGGSWAASSDSRIKENVGIYSKGLEHILLVAPVTYDYNGKGGMPKSAGYIGVIAQEIKDVFPETITTYKSKLEETDTEDTDLYRFDPSALIYALINAVKELKAEIELLKAN